MLDSLSAPAGADDDRSHEQRYHDGLQEAMRRLIAAGLVPERAGAAVNVLAYVSLADLMLLEGSSALLEEWTARAAGPVGRAPGGRRARAGTRGCGWTGTPRRGSRATPRSRRWWRGT